MKTLGVIVCALVLTASAPAYLLPSFTYEEMFARSDLVVIARPYRSRDTGKRTLDRNVNPAVHVAEVITDCQSFYILKGPKLKEFKLHHYRDLTDPKVAVIGGPTGISFNAHRRYLMFLVREADGRFAPFAGQTDVVDISVQEISSATVD